MKIKNRKKAIHFEKEKVDKLSYHLSLFMTTLRPCLILTTIYVRNNNKRIYKKKQRKEQKHTAVKEKGK